MTGKLSSLHLKDAPTSSSSKEVKVSCHGKMILIGEHAVVYGAKAVAMPVYGMGLTLNASNSSEPKFVIDGIDLSVKLNPLVEDAKNLLNIDEKNQFHFEGTSSLPLGAGLGSSAALSVAIIRALSSLNNISLLKSEISAFANNLEKRFHGSPSGLDVSVVAFDKPIVFQNENGPISVSELSHETTFNFALIDSGKRSSTIEMVEVASQYFKDKIAGPSLIKDFNQATNELICGMENGVIEKVKSAMNRACQLLETISVVPEDLKTIIKSSLDLGCLAVKPTGAGGGGCLLALLPSDTNKKTDILNKLIIKFGPKNIYGVTL